MNAIAEAKTKLDSRRKAKLARKQELRERFFADCVRQALGEKIDLDCYIDELWDCQAVSESELIQIPNRAHRLVQAAEWSQKLQAMQAVKTEADQAFAEVVERHRTELKEAATARQVANANFSSAQGSQKTIAEILKSDPEFRKCDLVPTPTKKTKSKA